MSDSKFTEWLKRTAPTRSPIPTTDFDTDRWFKEWAECRAIIGRFDGILSNLRKYGFTLVTGLFTASALFGGFGNATTKVRDVAVVFIGIMVLILVLFFVDTYYETLLNGAVERALDLENVTEQKVDVTKYLSTNAAKNGSTFATVFIYVGLLCTAGFVGFSIAGTGGVFDVTTWTYEQGLVVGWFLLLALLMLGYWLLAQIRTGGFTMKDR